MNGAYAKAFMKDSCKCSNFPCFEGKWDGTWKAGNYTLNRCEFEPKNYPVSLPSGFYKFILIYTDDNDVLIVKTATTFQVETIGGLG